jgi:cell division protease FtsH
VAFQADEEHPFLGYEISQGRDYSEATAARIDRDIQQMLAERHEAVRHLLAGTREQLDQLAQRLLKEESIDQEVLTQVLGARAAGAQPAQET